MSDIQNNRSSDSNASENNVNEKISALFSELESIYNTIEQGLYTGKNPFFKVANNSAQTSTPTKSPIEEQSQPPNSSTGEGREEIQKSSYDVFTLNKITEQQREIQQLSDKLNQLDEEITKLTSQSNKLNNEIELLHDTISQTQEELIHSSRFYQNFTKLSKILLIHQWILIFVPFVFIICCFVALYLLKDQSDFELIFKIVCGVFFLFSFVEFVDFLSHKFLLIGKVNDLEKRLDSLDLHKKNK